MEFFNKNSYRNNKNKPCSQRGGVEIWLVLIVAIIICGWSFWQLHLNSYAATQVLYSRDQAGDKAIISSIENSHQYIYFAMYTLTRSDIVDALIAAKLRGLDVRGVLDGSQVSLSEEKPLITKLQKFGVNLEIANLQDGLMHMKMLVTDNAYVSGSFNWTTAATNYNDEILEIGQVEGIRLQYLNIFQELAKRYAK